MGKSKIITYVVVAILILAGIYWVYSRMNQAPTAPAGVAVVSNTGAIVSDTPADPSSQFVSVLNDIDSIDLQNHLILSNKLFTSLKDFGRTIEDRAIGRDNPFAPFAPGAGIIASGTSNTSLATSSPNASKAAKVNTSTDIPAKVLADPGIDEPAQ